MKTFRPVFRFLCILSVCVAILGAGLGLYIYYLRAALRAELTVYLDEVAQRGVKILNTQIDGDVKSLQSAATAIAMHPHDLADRAWTDLLKEETKQNEFKRTAFIEPGGIAHLSDGFLLDLSHRDYFQQSLAGQTAVSDPLADAVDQGKAIILSVPVRTPQGKILGVLMAAHPTQRYGKLIAPDSFGGQGYSLIMKSNGEKVAFSSAARTNPSQENIFTTPGNEDFNHNKKVHADLQAGRSGAVRFFRPGEGWLYVSYQPVGINDWYLLSVVPEKVAAQKTHRLLALSLILCLAGLLAFVSLLLFIYQQKRLTSRMLYRSSYLDPITRRPNWAQVQKEIAPLLENSQDGLYAFVVFEIKNFQMIEDEQGPQRAHHLLRHIARVVAENLQPGELSSRVREGQFQLLLRYEDLGELKNRLELLNEKVNISMPAEAGTFQLVLSFGVYPIAVALPPEDLLLRATLACESLNGSYRDIVAFYDESMRQKISRAQAIENEMEGALRRKEFTLLLKPMCRADGRIVAAQGRVRWQGQDQRVREEDLFTSVFTQNGFITRLDAYMAEEAFRLLQQAPAGLPLLLNVSVLSMQDPRFAALLQKWSRQYQVAPQQLILQINPGPMNTTDIAALCQNSRAVHQAGFRLALNHFGQNNVSLPLMQKLPLCFARVKSPWPTDGKFRDKTPQIVQGLLELGQRMQVDIIFGTVQNGAQWHTLQGLGAQFYDGPFAGQAQPPEEFWGRVRQNASK